MYLKNRNHITLNNISIKNLENKFLMCPILYWNLWNISASIELVEIKVAGNKFLLKIPKLGC